jgi:DNA-binding transcriptional LysR family regulator
MARISPFSGIPEFLAVASHSNFRAAAAELGVTPAAVSQSIRSLESRLKLPLFQRTTRRVALTEVGSALFKRLEPAAADVERALESIGEFAHRATGKLRLSVPRIALELVVLTVLHDFRRLHPDVEVEVDVNDASVDLIGGGFDAGIRISEFIEQDMIAVKITPSFKWMVVGAPSYFALRGRPKVPEDLLGHECIRYRFPTARTVYHWQFVRRGGEYSLDAPGGVVVNDHMAMLALAKTGIGLAYTADLIAAPLLEAGELEGVLASHMPSRSGLSLYFPQGSQHQPTLRAFIDLAVRYGSPGP